MNTNKDPKCWSTDGAESSRETFPQGCWSVGTADLGKSNGTIESLFLEPSYQVLPLEGPLLTTFMDLTNHAVLSKPSTFHFLLQFSNSISHGAAATYSWQQNCSYIPSTTLLTSLPNHCPVSRGIGGHHIPFFPPLSTLLEKFYEVFKIFLNSDQIEREGIED